MASLADRQHIIDEINGLSKKEFKDNRATIICPFHNDTNPSGTVSLDETESRVALGWFRCWSCGASVSWDTLADQVGMRKLRKTRKSPDDYAKPSSFRQNLLGEEADDDPRVGNKAWSEDYSKLKFKSGWKGMEEWRGISTRMLDKVGARLAYHTERDRYYVWLPVEVRRTLRGYVLAKLEKPTPFVDREGKKVVPPSYLNAPGRWSNEYGLIYFDYAVSMANELGVDTLVLCEGPRDALRLLRYKIPAVSVLGALNWSEAKRMTVERSGINNLILFMDGDTAGKKAAHGIYRDVKMHFGTKVIKTWKLEPGADPFSCSKSLLRIVRSKLIYSE